MSSTTQILFHSPALNSLKRDQLVKLCKRHGLKANGKNAELVERLKQKASELPPEAIEWIDSEEEDDASLPGIAPPRPSEQWEMVMDNIQEEDESGANSGTMSSMKSVHTPKGVGEFGTTGTKSKSFALRFATATELPFRLRQVIAESCYCELFRSQTYSGQRPNTRCGNFPFPPHSPQSNYPP